MPMALEGIRVIDFTQLEFGPVGTTILGDYGADVIKIERIEGGDIQRNGGTSIRGLSANFLAFNRNKRSVAVDIRKQEGKQVIYDLVRVADVVAENFRPGVMDRLQLGYEHLEAINPRIIYASASGFGQTGPYRDRRGQDLAAQAMSGFASITGHRDDPPIVGGTWVADYVGAMNVAQGILIALLARERTGRGQCLETSLLNTAVALSPCEALEYLNTGIVPERGPRGSIHVGSPPTGAIYQAKDGYVAVNVVFMGGTNPLSAMCQVLEIEDLGTDPRFDAREKQLERYEELRDILAPAFLKKTVAEWVERFNEREIICAPVYTFKETFQDPQVLHNEMVVELPHPFGGTIKVVSSPLKLYDTPWQVRYGAPRLGAHTDEVLATIGYSQEKIAELRQNKAIG